MIVFVLALLPVLVAGALLSLCRLLRSRTGTYTRSTSRPLTRLRAATHWLLPCASVLAVGWIWANACGVFNTTYDRWLEAQEWSMHPRSSPVQPSGRTAIIVLGGGTEHTGPHRLLRPEGESIEKIALAANVYKGLVAAMPSVSPLARASAKPPLVIVSGGDPEHHGAAEADVYAPALIELGIPAADVIAENRSLNTYQNAERVAPLLTGQHVDRLILITTAMHMRRSILDFARFGMQVEPLAPPLTPGRISLWPDVENLKRAGAALHEIVGIQQFRVYRALDWF